MAPLGALAGRAILTTTCVHPCGRCGGVTDSLLPGAGVDRVTELFSQALGEQVAEQRGVQQLIMDVKGALSRIEVLTGDQLRETVHIAVQATTGPAVDGAVARGIGPGLAELRTGLDALDRRVDELMRRLESVCDAVSGMPTGVDLDALAIGLAALRTVAATHDDVEQVVRFEVGQAVAGIHEGLSNLPCPPTLQEILEAVPQPQPVPTAAEVSTLVDAVIARQVDGLAQELQAALSRLLDDLLAAVPDPPSAQAIAAEITGGLAGMRADLGEENALLLLGDPRGAWAVGAMAAANAAIGLAQEVRAKRHLDRLDLLGETRARVVRGGAERLVLAGDVVRGDVLRLAAGDAVVADGPVLVAAFLEIDEALLTGESDPVARRPGDRLLSGSFAVAGVGSYRADGVGAEGSPDVAGEKIEVGDVAEDEAVDRFEVDHHPFDDPLDVVHVRHLDAFLRQAPLADPNGVGQDAVAAGVSRTRCCGVKEGSGFTAEL